MQLEFVSAKLGELSQKQILDIGCATGELGFHLAKNGARVIGIDLNQDLLAQAKLNKVHSNLAFQQGNMLTLDYDFSPGQFDAVLCFGNTLVHLQSDKLVEQMLNATLAVLKSGGKFLLQILNYDYIVGDQISELPVIDTEKIMFVRRYDFHENSDLIGFQTKLEIKAENRMVSNETPLLALKSKKLVRMLETAGFKNIQLYANFKEDDFGGKHIPLVLSCQK